MTRALLFIAAMLAGLSPTDACQRRWQVHHDAFVNQAISFRALSKAEAYAVLSAIKRQPFDLDYADAYEFDEGYRVYFFWQGCAVTTIDVPTLPAIVSAAP